MYDTELTRISLPDKEYIYLLGVSLSVFLSNNGFVIENILNTDGTYSWYDLIDKQSGSLKSTIKNTITQKAGDKIEQSFSDIVDMRNRIIHGFRITSEDDEQILATKEKGSNEQYYIDKEYLKEFIKKNNDLSDLLDGYRRSTLP